MKKKISVIHGPNLNLLGSRESSIYGKVTLEEINENLESLAKQHGAELHIFQSNHEGDIVDHIHCLKDYDGLIINPAAFTHTSVAIRDAILAIGVPVIEIHVSNIFAREEFRHHSFVSDIALGVISGMGPKGYEFALESFLAN